MSSEMPGPAGGSGSEPTHEVEYLGEEGHGGRTSARRWGIVAAATVGVLGVAGAGAWGVSALMGGGSGAANAVPGNALAYLSLDLDPGAGQKVEAYQMMRKFPALKEKLGDGEDLRRSLVEAMLTDAPCDDLDFASDFDPWLGNRVAVSVLPGDDEPVPFFVLEVKDEDKARDGVRAVAECGDAESELPGTAFVDGYMVLAEDDAVAQRIADDAEAGSLAEDAGFERWVDEAGGSGIVTGYVSAEAPKVLLDAAMAGAGDPAALLDGSMDGQVVFEPEETATDALEAGDEPGTDELEQKLAEQLEEFEGAAMVLRFDDGALELETAASVVGEGLPSDGSDSGLVDLPASTAVALGFGVGDDTVSGLMDNLADSLGEEELDAMVAQAEAQTGLTLPEDLEALLGDGMSFAMDSSIDLNAMFGVEAGAMNLPVGVRISGDPAAIVPVLEKVVTAAGVQEQVVIEEGDGVVAVGVTPDYVAELVDDGALGDQEGFQSALPDLDDSAGGLFVDFDTEDWLAKMIEGEDAELLDNLEPLDSLGVTGQVDGDVMRASVRLSTD
jgi:hypothetical protein